jgi:release factor glutamine methyltransferase
LTGVRPGSDQGQTLHEQISLGRQTLIDAGLPPEGAALDADVIARHVLGWDLARLLAHNREPAAADFIQQFERAIARRARREPVAMIVGHREFWGLDFLVTPATLVPRPETEFIVEEALRFLPVDGPARVLDVGTGTGCLAIAIASERPAAKIIASDISHDALVVARENATRLKVSSQITFVRTDLAAGIQPARFDVIVSNPPYVPDQTAAALSTDVVRYEPHTALFGGEDGLDVMRRLLAEAVDSLAPGGTCIVEFGFGQEDAMRDLARQLGWQVVGVRHDLQDIPRTLVLGR